MEFKDLYPFVLMLVMIGMLLGIGILVLDNFRTTGTGVSTAITNESFVMPAANATGTSLAHGNITAFTYVLNSTGDTCDATDYTITLASGAVLNTGQPKGCHNGTTVYAYYTYTDYNNAAATSMVNTRNAIATISTSWLPLIVIVAVLALILGLVIRSFNARR